ncbi:MAG: hypothetical protein JWN92_2597 [Candidatus Acidoferrum typicum]|nr:hypothetical protein [Candidatus Acidoferrum typicum]
MSSDLVLVLSTFGIGIVAGLRSMTAPAVVSWAARLHRLDLRDSGLGFLASAVSVYILSALGIGELVADKLPFVPNRTSLLPMSFRILSGAICGAALCISANRMVLEGVLLGGLGAANGAFGGFHVRRLLVRHLKITDKVIALAEDALAIGVGVFIVSRF